YPLTSFSFSTSVVWVQTVGDNRPQAKAGCAAALPAQVDFVTRVWRFAQRNQPAIAGQPLDNREYVAGGRRHPLVQGSNGDTIASRHSVTQHPQHDPPFRFWQVSNVERCDAAAVVIVAQFGLQSVEDAWHDELLLIDLRHFDRFRLRPAHATPDRVGNDDRLWCLV